MLGAQVFWWVFLSCSGTPVALECIDEAEYDQRLAAVTCRALFVCSGGAAGGYEYADEEACRADRLSGRIPDEKQRLLDVCPQAVYDACEAGRCLELYGRTPAGCSGYMAASCAYGGDCELTGTE